MASTSFAFNLSCVSSRLSLSYNAVIFSVCPLLIGRSFQADGSFVASQLYHTPGFCPEPHCRSTAQFCPSSSHAQLHRSGPSPYACSETYHLANMERTGKEWIGNQKSRTAAICPKKGSRQRKLSATKSAVHTMKCLPPAAARNGSATR